MNIWQVSIKGYPHTQAFDMVALCLRESIRDLGFESRIVNWPDQVSHNIILGAYLLTEVPERSIIYNLEQITPESPLVNEDYINILKNNRVWDYSKRNIEELKRLGIEAVHMPIGYHPVLNKSINTWLHTNTILPSSQPIDCLFYGSLNLRRKTIIENAGATPVFNVYGTHLDDYITRSKIILNCHFYETQLFEIVRCSYLLANKKFILSETGLDLELEEPFREGIAFHKKEEIPEACEFYLKFPDIRERIANKGYEIFSQMKQVEYLRDESKSW